MYLNRRQMIAASAGTTVSTWAGAARASAGVSITEMLCHNMCSPVGTIASGHACLAIRSFVALESDSVEIPDWQHVVHWGGPLYRDGYLEIPNKPGLGIELNEDICRKHLSPGSQLFE